MNIVTKPVRPAQQQPELTPPGSPPHVAVAAGFLDHDHAVIRSDDDTDEDFEARRRVLAAALSFARKG